MAAASSGVRAASRLAAASGARLSSAALAGGCRAAVPPADAGGGARLARREIFAGRTLRLSVDRVRLPNGQETELEHVRHPGAAAVVALDDDGDVLLIRQYRYATGGWLLEVPAGKLDAGETPEACAARELAEETGHHAARLVPMGSIWTAPGFTDERIRLFLATGLSAAHAAPERDEVITLERTPLERALAMAAGGEIADAKSICALLRTPRFIR